MLERIILIVFLTLIGSAAILALKQIQLFRLGRQAASGQPRLLYFRSDNCAPCITQAHYLEQVMESWNGRLTIEKIDTDAEPAKANQYGILTLPTTILVDTVGEVRQINYGLTSSRKLNNQVASMQMTSQ